MKRLTQWATYLSRRLELDVELLSIGGAYEEACERSGTGATSHGFFCDELDWVVVRLNPDRSESLHLKTLFHEVGHYLYKVGRLPVSSFTCYMERVDVNWLNQYVPGEREEEQLVESFALWGADLTEEGEVNLSFKEFIKTL